MPSKSQSRLISPLRYPGSKRRLVKYIQEALLANDCHPKLFIEPFAGGASVALQLLNDGIVDKVGLVDLDPLIASFWHCVFFDAAWLIKQILEVKVTFENWKIFKASNPKTRRGRALKCLFLNRTNFSGILERSVGPIGGKTQASNYDIACRFPKQTLVKRIQQAHSLKDKIAFVWCADWNVCLDRIPEIASGLEDSDVFLYLDPPFYEKAKKLYTYYFEEADHKALHDVLVKTPYRWLLSYDPAKPIEVLYSSNGSRPKRVEMLYTAASSIGPTTAQELIITNLPELPAASRFWNTRKKTSPR